MTGQWAPLFVGAIMLPALRGLWLVKPTVGLAYLAGWGIGRAAIGVGALLVVLAFAWEPDWPWRWISATRMGSAHLTVPLILRPGGFLLLLPLLWWRRPEARLVAVLALVPQTPTMYDTLPLGMIPRTRRQMILAVACSQLVVLWSATGTVRPPLWSVRRRAGPSCYSGCGSPRLGSWRGRRGVREACRTWYG